MPQTERSTFWNKEDDGSYMYWTQDEMDGEYYYQDSPGQQKEISEARGIASEDSRNRREPRLLPEGQGQKQEQGKEERSAGHDGPSSNPHRRPYPLSSLFSQALLDTLDASSTGTRTTTIATVLEK